MSAAITSTTAIDVPVSETRSISKPDEHLGHSCRVTPGYGIRRSVEIDGTEILTPVHIAQATRPRLVSASIAAVGAVGRDLVEIVRDAVGLSIERTEMPIAGL